MKKIDIDGITLRYFPWIGVRFVRYVVCFFAFFVYSYLVFPFRNLTNEKLHSLILISLFGLFIMADGSYLLQDVTDAPVHSRAVFQGNLLAFEEGSGGAGSKSFVVEGKRFKLISVRSRGSIERLRRMQGKRLTIWYLEADGLITHWNLPVHIETISGEVIYDYQEFRSWFLEPMNNLDRFWILAYKVVLSSAILFFPLQLISRLYAKEGNL